MEKGPPYSLRKFHTQEKESGEIRRSHLTSLIGKYSLFGCLTCYETFNRSAHLHRDNICIGERKCDSLGNLTRFVFKSYYEIFSLVENFSSGLLKENLVPRNSENLMVIGLYLKNSTNWVVCEQACFRISAVTVPLYETFDANTIGYIIKQTEMTTIVSISKNVGSILAMKRKSDLLHLQAIIVSDNIPEDLSLIIAAKKLNIRLLSFDHIVRVGRAFPSPPRPPSPESLASFCYTSGTTGNPKGAMLTHRNFITVMVSGLEGVINVQSADLYLSFLPLAHIFERVVINGLLASGSGIAFYSGDLLKLVDDLKNLRPTIFCAVPRLLNRIRDKILQVTLNALTGLTAILILQLNKFQ